MKADKLARILRRETGEPLTFCRKVVAAMYAERAGHMHGRTRAARARARQLEIGEIATPEEAAAAFAALRRALQ